MKKFAELFAGFPPVGKAGWMAQVARDLKGRDPAGLHWRLSEDWSVSPFVHPDDQAGTVPQPDALEAGWEICEDVDAADASGARTQALEALEYGAEGLTFHLSEPPSGDFLSRLTVGIHREYIGLHFSGPGLTQNPGAVLAWLEQSGARPEQRGSLAYDPAAAPGIHDWRYLADLLRYGRERFPRLRLIGVDGMDLYRGAAGTVEALAGLLRRGHTYLEKLTARGLPPGEINAALEFTLPVGTEYFLEIAQRRAFRRLWLHVLRAWEAPLEYPHTAARFHPAAYTGDLYTNLVRATTMAMSAVLGGARRLTVRPYDAGRESEAAYPRAFARRIARNVQHLLKLEAGFETLQDPGAGSYYIEQLTRELAEKAWARFADSSKN